jgi:hypothetical protein
MKSTNLQLVGIAAFLISSLSSTDCVKLRHSRGMICTHDLGRSRQKCLETHL